MYILDTCAFFTQKHPEGEFLTVPGIKKEIINKQSRQYYENMLSRKLKIMKANEHSYKIVKEQAKALNTSIKEKDQAVMEATRKLAALGAEKTELELQTEEKLTELEDLGSKHEARVSQLIAEIDGNNKTVQEGIEVLLKTLGSLQKQDLPLDTPNKIIDAVNKAITSSSQDSDTAGKIEYHKTLVGELTELGITTTTIDIEKADANAVAGAIRTFLLNEDAKERGILAAKLENLIAKNFCMNTCSYYPKINIGIIFNFLFYIIIELLINFFIKEIISLDR